MSKYLTEEWAEKVRESVKLLVVSNYLISGFLTLTMSRQRTWRRLVWANQPLDVCLMLSRKRKPVKNQES